MVEPIETLLGMRTRVGGSDKACSRWVHRRNLANTSERRQCGIISDYFDHLLLLLLLLLRPRQRCEVLQSLCLYVCLSVCLSVRISQKPHVQTSRNFLYMLPVAVARICSDNCALRYVLPVLWMFAPTHRLVAHRGGKCTGPPPALCRHLRIVRLYSVRGERMHSPPRRVTEAKARSDGGKV